ncbi:alpha/beta hydrolase [Pollutibacter soli]|uniref:alpha/beta fold hydrolase n=1 Tax=Pollutibacter soli TaxID=3034157 RepID=UPI0030133DD0
MKFITTTRSGEEHKIAYSDYGQGSPVVLIHGWPLSREMWEYQLEDLVNAGHRVIKYDRLGFGKSSKPWDGYDYDSLADDLNVLMEDLDLQDTTLVGFSMGGGEVVRYLSRFGRNRVRRIALIASVTPFMLKTLDNPEGVDPAVFDEMMEKIREDRIAFLDDFGKKFFGVNLLSHPVSNQLLDYYRMLCSFASANSTLKCVEAFSQTDFRDDLRRVQVPTLIIHGDADKTVPIEASAERTAKIIPHATYIVYQGAPHGLFYTHRKQLNRDLISFMSGQMPFGKSIPEEKINYV